MLVVDQRAFRQAVDAMTATAISVSTVEGLKVASRVPGPEQIRAIVLGAVVALTGEPCCVSDEAHISFGDLNGPP